jgi:hypothetical protein
MQPRRVGEALVLVVRPQEAVAAVQAFGQTTTDFYGAVADYNRAQFRLYRAIGHPAQCLAGAVPAPAQTPASPPAPAQPAPTSGVPPVPGPFPGTGVATPISAVPATASPPPALPPGLIPSVEPAR